MFNHFFALFFCCYEYVRIHTQTTISLSGPLDCIQTSVSAVMGETASLNFHTNVVKKTECIELLTSEHVRKTFLAHCDWFTVGMAAVCASSELSLAPLIGAISSDRACVLATLNSEVDQFTPSACTAFSIGYRLNMSEKNEVGHTELCLISMQKTLIFCPFHSLSTTTTFMDLKSHCGNCISYGIFNFSRIPSQNLNVCVYTPDSIHLKPSGTQQCRDSVVCISVWIWLGVRNSLLFNLTRLLLHSR